MKRSAAAKASRTASASLHKTQAMVPSAKKSSSVKAVTALQLKKRPAVKDAEFHSDKSTKEERKTAKLMGPNLKASEDMLRVWMCPANVHWCADRSRDAEQAFGIPVQPAPSPNLLEPDEATAADRPIPHHET